MFARIFCIIFCLTNNGFMKINLTNVNWRAEIETEKLCKNSPLNLKKRNWLAY